MFILLIHFDFVLKLYLNKDIYIYYYYWFNGHTSDSLSSKEAKQLLSAIKFQLLHIPLTRSQ